MSSTTRRASIAVVIAGLAAACGPAGQGAASAGSAVPPTAASTPDGPRSITSGTLPAGRYRTTLFEPPLSFALADGWLSLFPDDPDEIAFERNGYTEGFYISRVGQVVDPATHKVVSAPEDIVDWLSDHPAFVVVKAPAAVTVAGATGRTIELDVTAEDETEVFAYPTGNTRVHLGWRLRYTALPMDGPVLVLTCFGASQAAFQEACALADGSLASLDIQD